MLSKGMAKCKTTGHQCCPREWLSVIQQGINVFTGVNRMRLVIYCQIYFYTYKQFDFK